MRNSSEALLISKFSLVLIFPYKFDDVKNKDRGGGQELWSLEHDVYEIHRVAIVGIPVVAS